MLLRLTLALTAIPLLLLLHLHHTHARPDPSTTTAATASKGAEQGEPQAAEEERKQLPPAPSDGTAHKLDLSTGRASLVDKLGPLVINKDGTTSRITNWHGMTATERATTLRIVTARNRRRLQALKEEL